MKKLIALLLVFALMSALAACAKKPVGTNSSTKPAASDTSDTSDSTGSAEQITDANGNVLPDNLPDGAITAMHETFDNMEYSLYRNVFQDTSTKEYDGKKFTKEGTFAILQDEWSGKLRYYVWGFADQTRCCDYQWEFIPADVNALPPVGSYIRVKGKMAYTEDQKSGALDHYWLDDTEMEVLEEYTPSKYDYDLTTMSATLARVQLFSMQNYSDKFADKTVLIYGRAYSPNTLQHPYYDECWYLDFKTTDNKTPATGQYLLLGGKLTVEDGGCWLDVSAYHEV